MLYGEYNHNIDAKGRMNFPAKMRDELGASFIVTRWSDDCLAALTEREWNRIAERIQNMPLSETSEIARYMFSNANLVEPDKQGRIMLPASLREAAGLDKDVTVIGVMNRAEIWSTERWNEHKKQLNSSSFEARLKEIGL